MNMDDILNKIGKLNQTANADHSVVLERVLKTATEMLKDRGFAITNDCRTMGDVIYKIQENEPIFTGENANSRYSTATVYFYNEERIGVKQLRLWNEKHDGLLIIVSLEGPTAFTKREAEQSYKNIQFFTFKDLCVNITHHKLVPKHERLNEEEKKKLNFNENTQNEWPKMYTSDVVCQYYNYDIGDIIRITRTIGYPEPVYFYRLVCAPVSQ